MVNETGHSFPEGVTAGFSLRDHVEFDEAADKIFSVLPVNIHFTTILDQIMSLCLASNDKID